MEGSASQPGMKATGVLNEDPAPKGRPVASLLSDTGRTHPDSPAIAFMGTMLTYGELDRLVDRAAAGLQSLGVKPGTRVGLCLPNTPYSVVFFFAVLRIGGVVVNFNPLYVERELTHLVRDSGTEIMVTIDLALIYPKVARVAAETGLRHVVVCSMAAALPWAKGLAFRVARRRDLARVVPDRTTLTYDALLKRGVKPAPVAIDPDELAVLQYTGGTTGLPKGAELTHTNITTATAMVIHGLGMKVTGRDRVLGVLPLFHVFAILSVMCVPVQMASLIILVPRFELEQVLRLIETMRPTMFPGVPTIFSALVDAAAKRKVDMSSIELCIAGGAPLPVEVRHRFMELTGCALMEGYGLSETAGGVCFTPPGSLYKDGSIGLPFIGTTVEIRDPADPRRLMGAGERGEICIRGPQVMRGYWNQREETARVMIDGALRTGDIGYLDEDGYIFLVDRIKDVIIAGGYNIYPRVLEEALYQHPAVRDAVVIGIPDAYRGQAPKAFVTLKQDMEASPGELRAFMADYVSKIELPKDIEIRDELPKTMVGKLSKKELVEEEAAKISASAG